MGLFNETEEEKNYKKLIKAIKNSNLPSPWMAYLVEYVSGVSNGSIANDFYNQELLTRVILKVTEAYAWSETYPEVEFKRVVNLVNLMLPFGEHSLDFDGTIEMIINNFLGENGILTKGLFDKEFYALFQNRYDYLFIMNIIRNDEDLINNADRIFRYALEVSPYCSNQQILKNEILAFMNNLENEVYDLNEYHERMLSEAKKRCGVYPIDEKTLALISSEAEKAQALIEKLKSMQQKVDTYQELVKTLTLEGKKDIKGAISGGVKEIKGYSESAVKEMRESIETSKKEIIEQLDQYILLLEEGLKKSSDQVFNEVLERSSKRLREIKVAAQNLSTTATSELLRIQSATEDSVSKLREYVENEPQLQELLKGASDDEKIREALLSISSLQTGAETQAVVATPTSGIIIPGNDRLVIPANPSVVIPDGEHKSIIIPAFDESISFETRLKRILDQKKKREQNGEIFHEMTEEIIRCLLEGDWVYLWGPSGCGKSYTIRQIAELIGLDMIDNGKITDKYSIMAYNDANGNFRATQAFVALVYGKLLLLDEFDNGNPDTQVVLNELYSGLLDVLENPNKPRYVTFAEDMTVPISPNFRMISAGNTTGAGENPAFSSRGKIDESVQQRMTPKRFWYDNRVEQRIFGEYTAWYGIFANFRKACDAYAKREGLDTPIGITTTRDAAAIVKYIRHNSKSVDQVLDEKFVQTKSLEYLDYIQKKFRDYYGIGKVSEGSAKMPKQLSKVDEEVLAKRLILRCSKDKEKSS